MGASVIANGASTCPGYRAASLATARLKELRTIPTRLPTEGMGEITRLGAMSRVLVLLGMIAGVHQASTGCKHCTSVGKEEKAMFRTHSEACLATSKADPAQVEALCRGDLIDTPQLRAHVYCVLLKCKVVGKDGKLQKAAVLDKAAIRGTGKDVSKILENCAEHQTGDTPEDLTWDLFRCSYDKKAILFDYMPTAMSTLHT